MTEIPAEAPRGARQSGSEVPPTAGPYLRLDEVVPGDANRDELESYVRAAFLAKHGAAVHSFMPTLLGFRDRQGALRGVAGVRGAHEERLYLEQYLDVSIEQALSAALSCATGRPRHGARAIRRNDIVEVGNLAGGSCRAAVRIVAQLPGYLMRRRYSWIVFTATSAVRQILAGFGAPLIDLGRAERSCLAGGNDEWGRYYETDPRVFAGRLQDAEGLAGFIHHGGAH